MDTSSSRSRDARPTRASSARRPLALALTLSLLPAAAAAQYVAVAPAAADRASDRALDTRLRRDLDDAGFRPIEAAERLRPGEYCVEFVVSTIPLPSGRWDAVISTAFVKRHADGSLRRTRPEIPYHFHSQPDLESVARRTVRHFASTVTVARSAPGGP